MNFNLIPSLNNYKVKLADFLASARLFKIYDLIFVNEETDQFYRGNGSLKPSELLPFQTALKHHRPASAHVTETLTIAQFKAGVIISTSAALVTLTTPTAIALVADLGAKHGTWFDFAIQNTGPNTVTLAGGAGVTAAAAVVTGGDTLTVDTDSVGLFRIYFSSWDIAKIYRLG